MPLALATAAIGTAILNELTAAFRRLSGSHPSRRRTAHLFLVHICCTESKVEVQFDTITTLSIVASLALALAALVFFESCNQRSTLKHKVILVLSYGSKIVPSFTFVLYKGSTDSKP